MAIRDGRSVEELYASSRGDLPFERLVSEHGAGRDDDSLAELIEADGRARIAMGRQVELKRYLGAVPGLESRPVPLDAAIDVTLRWMSSASRPTVAAVQELEGKYPQLSSSIRAAASLAQAMWSTTGLREKFEGPRRPVPSEFGPKWSAEKRRYELRRLLGSGGWGEVYLAVDRQLSDRGHEALVAIKFLTGMDRSPWARERLKDEASKARRAVHPNVARVLDRGVSDEGEDYLVYEFVGGGDLSQWLAQRQKWPSAREAVSLVAKVARGVQAAHAAGLVHCDLKPGNILMGSDGEPRVSDFGIAVRKGERTDLPASRDGRPMGNLAFISPEQYRSEEGAFSVASDVYALGGLLYYMVTRMLPNGDSVEEIAGNHAKDGGRAAPPSFRDRLSWLDRDLASTCERAMALKPSQRYASAAELADDLEAWLRREPVHWTRPSLGRRTLMWGRRSRVAAMFLIAALVIGGLGAWASLHWSGVASEKALEAKVVTEQMSTARGAFGLAIQARRWGNRSGASTNVLPEVIAWDWLFGEFMTSTNFQDQRTRWITRVDAVRELIERRTNGGMAQTVGTAQWQTVLAYFLLDMGRYEEAVPVLTENLRLWQKLLHDQSDPAIEQVVILYSISEVQRVKAKLNSGLALGDEDRKQLETAAVVLVPQLKISKAQDATSPVQRLALRALDDLCSPAMLDLTAEYPGAHERAKVLEDLMRSGQ